MKSDSGFLNFVYNKNRILAFMINNSGKYSAYEIGNLFGFSGRRIQEFVKEYNTKGFIFKTLKGKYSLESVPYNFKIIRKKINSEEFKKLELELELKEALKKEKVVSKKIFIKNYIPICMFTDSELYINKLLFELRDEGYIDIYNDKITSVMKDDFYNFDEEQILKILIYFNIIKNIFPKGRMLHEIYSKLILKYKSMGKNYNSRFIMYPHKNKISFYEEFILEKIETAVIKNKKIEIDYFGKKGIIKRVIEPSGLVYVSQKDLWYVVDCSNGEAAYRLDKIIRLKVLQEVMQSQFKKKLYEDSIGISNEPIYDVEVQFEKEDFIYSKLTAYSKRRKNSEIIQNDNKYILKDKVRGILEFEKWVRSFGKSAYVIKPEKLKSIILDDLKLLLKRYAEDGTN